MGRDEGATVGGGVGTTRIGFGEGATVGTGVGWNVGLDVGCVMLKVHQ